jgi:shikimate kinase
MSQPPSSVRSGAHLERLSSPALDPRLRGRTIVLVGLMGAGKTTIGRGLAQVLRLPFRDADEEIERAAGCTVSQIFEERGEAAFRDGERRVIARLLTQETPHVLAFGGGAFMHPETRSLVAARAVSVWIKADLEVLANRVSRRNTRPLLIGKDPLEVLRAHAETRYPAYAQATVTVETGEIPTSAAVAAVLAALADHLVPLEPLTSLNEDGLAPPPPVTGRDDRD